MIGLDERRGHGSEWVEEEKGRHVVAVRFDLKRKMAPVNDGAAEHLTCSSSSRPSIKLEGKEESIAQVVLARSTVKMLPTMTTGT